MPEKLTDRLNFVLPARNGAGGTRVTVRMANELGRRGWDVRLLYRRFWEQIAKEKQWPSGQIVVFDKTFGRDN